MRAFCAEIYLKSDFLGQQKEVTQRNSCPLLMCVRKALPAELALSPVPSLNDTVEHTALMSCCMLEGQAPNLQRRAPSSDVAVDVALSGCSVMCISWQ